MRTSARAIVLTILMFMFTFLYVGFEATYGILVSTFSVKSNLHLTKVNGAYVTAVFYGSFASMR